LPRLHFTNDDAGPWVRQILLTLSIEGVHSVLNVHSLENALHAAGVILATLFTQPGELGDTLCLHDPRNARPPIAEIVTQR
jgi:hypothetical protein